MSGHREPVPAVMDYSDAYWLGCLSEHLRAVLRGDNDAAASLAAEALADFDAWCTRRDAALEWPAR